VSPTKQAKGDSGQESKLYQLTEWRKKEETKLSQGTSPLLAKLNFIKFKV